SEARGRLTGGKPRQPAQGTARSRPRKNSRGNRRRLRIIPTDAETASLGETRAGALGAAPARCDGGQARDAAARRTQVAGGSGQLRCKRLGCIRVCGGCYNDWRLGNLRGIIQCDAALGFVFPAKLLRRLLCCFICILFAQIRVGRMLGLVWHT
ncbi:hypothetical protein U1Q18_037730, partial [Sarracenia purpurea var. burkii]